MDNASYATLTRQAGLLREMQSVAHNVANLSTTGYRAEGVIFSEHVEQVDGAPSLSMATASGRNTSSAPGVLSQTGNPFDLAIEGDGFFMIQTPEGDRLTRAGNFTPSAEGDLVTLDGHLVLDAGGAPIFVPPDASPIAVAPDGTVSADGRPLGQIGLFQPENPLEMTRHSGVMFSAESGYVPADDGAIVQGFLEGSNVDAIAQMARLVEVQRAYEMGQGFLDNEDERIRSVVRSLSQ